MSETKDDWVPPAGSGIAANTDRELWRETPGDYYSPSLHVTATGGIGINVGGHVIVRPIRWWARLADHEETLRAIMSEVGTSSAAWKLANDSLTRRM